MILFFFFFFTIFILLFSYLYLKYQLFFYKILRHFIKYIAVLALLLIDFLSMHIVYAADNPSAVIIPQQQQAIEQEQLNREIQDFKNWEKGREKAPEENFKNQSNESNGCFNINEIRLDGNTLLSKKEIAKISLKYLNTCITTVNINELIITFSNAYKNKGYITTQTYIKEQNLMSGVLIITVIEGKVEDITFGNNSISDKITNYFITPLAKNKRLHIKDIDQTTENLSYISSYNYTTNIEAGSKAGLSKISINGSKSLPFSIYIEADTTGQKYTGHNKYTFGSKIDNPLKLGDSLNLKYSSTFNDSSDGKYSRAFIGSWSMPIKWARIGINSSYSTYLTTVQGQLQSFQSSGVSTSHSFSINGIVFRNKSTKTTLFSTLNLLNSKSYINDVLSNTQSKKLTNMDIGIMNNWYTPYGSFFHKLTYIKGLKLFGSIKDTEDTAYNAQFDALRFYHLYSIKTDKIFNIKLPFTFQNTIDSQYSWQEVYSQNQFVLGGFYSVRGFRDVNVYGSNGIITRNDIDFALIDYIKPTNYFTKFLTNNGKGGLTLGAFFDIGQTTSYLENTKPAPGAGDGNLSSGNYGVMAGAGYKINYTSKYFQTSLTVAHSIKYPSYLSNSVKQNDGRVVYLTIRGNW